jgi:glycosyltransferase involved in cell wall biosynthesis
MKVLLLNSYDMYYFWEKWKKESCLGHHLWGATHLPQYGIDVDILTHEKYAILKKISEKIKILGDLDQQLRILFRKDDYDVVYSGHHLTTLFLAFLRGLGIFQKPLVAITYQSFEKNFWSQLFTSFFVEGHDRLLCLNHVIKDHLIDEFNVPKDKLEVLEWGIDLSSYINSNQEPIYEEKDYKNTFIMSAGKTYRDYATLVKAFNNLNFSLKIYSSGQYLGVINNLEVASNIDVVNGSVSWQEILAAYKKAYAVTIPLDIKNKTGCNPIGLTSLIETMAMGKAVIMTRNRAVGIDIEKEGIGIFVEAGDVNGWQQAITYLLENPDVTKEMGKRGRRLCEEKYSLELFSSRLANLLKGVVT